MKSLLLFSLFFFNTQIHAQEVISADRFLIKIIDRVVSFQDIQHQLRNLKALDCIYDDSLVVSYFKKSFIQELSTFVTNFPEKDDLITQYLHNNTAILKKVRIFFKMLRYSEDQNKKISSELSDLVREGTREYRCDTEILHKDGLKTNFKGMLSIELYLRSRYEGQLKSSKRNFESIRSSIDLFVDSLDKQFTHEYYK